MSSLFRRLKTEATFRTLREMLRPRPRLVCLLKLAVLAVLVMLAVEGGLTKTGVTVAALSDLPITRTGSSAAVMVLRRRWPNELMLLEWAEEAEVEAELVVGLVLVGGGEAQGEGEAA